MFDSWTLVAGLANNYYIFPSSHSHEKSSIAVLSPDYIAVALHSYCGRVPELCRLGIDRALPGSIHESRISDQAGDLSVLGSRNPAPLSEGCRIRCLRRVVSFSNVPGDVQEAFAARGSEDVLSQRIPSARKIDLNVSLKCDSNASALVPARKSSNGVQSPRHQKASRDKQFQLAFFRS
jgi:hypothetical protein